MQQQHLCTQAVLVQTVLLLVASDSCELGQSKAAADSGEFGLRRRSHGFTATDALPLIGYRGHSRKVER